MKALIWIFVCLLLCFLLAEAANPTSQPSGQPSRQPTQQPTRQPTIQPSSQPTSQPSNPSGQPTSHPSCPSGQPTSVPTCPSGQPSRQPTSQPTRQPTCQPTMQPSRQPTSQPTRQPTSQPTSNPSSPTGQPTSHPSNPTGQPTRQPSNPTGQPSRQPTSQPTSAPSITVGNPSLGYSIPGYTNISVYWCKPALNDIFDGNLNGFQAIFGNIAVSSNANTNVAIKTAVIRVLPYVKGVDYLSLIFSSAWQLDISAAFNSNNGRLTISTISSTLLTTTVWNYILSSVAYKLTVMDDSSYSCLSYTNYHFSRKFVMQVFDAGGKRSNILARTLKVKTAALMFTDAIVSPRVISNKGATVQCLVDLHPNAPVDEVTATAYL